MNNKKVLCSASQGNNENENSNENNSTSFISRTRRQSTNTTTSTTTTAVTIFRVIFLLIVTVLHSSASLSPSFKSSLHQTNHNLIVNQHNIIHKNNNKNNNNNKWLLTSKTGTAKSLESLSSSSKLKMISSSRGGDGGDVSGDTTNDEELKEKKRRIRRISVATILAASFLNLLGFTMAGPITPALGKHFGLEVGASFGSLTSAYPLGMLFGLFLWPALSDSMGRKPIIAASLMGSGLGLAAQSIVIRREASLAWFLGCRALTGAFAGSSPVSKAYLADIGYKDGKLPRYLALRDAASTMAFIAGPMLGGIIYDLRRLFLNHNDPASNTGKLIDMSNTAGSLSFVIGVSAAASLAAGILVGLLVKDVKPKKKKKNNKAGTGNGSSDSDMDDDDDDDEKGDVSELVACPLGQRMWAGVASVCVVSFLFNVGDSTFHAFFSALLRDSAGIATKDIGLLYTLLACISFAISTTGSSRLVKSIGPVATCAAGLGLVGSGLMALGLSTWTKIAMIQPQFLFLAAAAAIYYSGVPLYGPTIPTMLLQCVPSHRRGAIMGLDGTINTIGRIISPLVMGDIYRRYGPGAAFGLAGVAAFGGALTALLRRYIVLNGLYGKKKKSD